MEFQLKHLFYTINLIFCIIPIIEIIYLVARVKVSNLSQKLLLATVGCFFIDVGYFFLISSQNYVGAVFGSRIEILGSTFFYYFFLRFVMDYIKMKGYFHGNILAGIAALLFVISFWTEWPKGLVLNGMERVPWQMGLYRLIIHYGTGAWILFAGVLIGYIYIFIQCYLNIRRCRGWKEKRNAIRLTLALVVSLMPAVVLMFRVTADFFPAFCTLSCLILVVGLFRGEFFAVKEQGRDWVFEHMDGAVVIIDNMQGYLEANRIAQELFPKLMGMQRNQVIPQEVMDIIKQPEDEVQIGTKYYNRQVMELRQRDKTAGYALLLNDQTNLYYLIDQWREEKYRADQANEEKSAFLSRMSHEIRTPMNAIVGMTDLLRRQAHTDQEREYLDNIAHSGKSLLRIINDILDFSKIEAGKLNLVEEEYNILELVNELNLIFLNRIGSAPIELYYDVDPELPQGLLGDELRIRQVIINIMNNAIKYTDSGSVKLIVLGERTSQEELLLKIQVEDTGRGIPEKEMPKLFESYEQTNLQENRYKEGTGLGLAITKQLVNLMGGNIYADSIYKKGSTFTVEIPQKIVNNELALNSGGIQPDTLIGYYFEDDKMKEFFKELSKYYKIPIRVLGTEADLEGVTHIFTDTVDESKLEYLDQFENYKIRLCQFLNPMITSDIKFRGRMFNKPLYCVSFIQAILGYSEYEKNERGPEAKLLAPEAKVLVVDDNEMNRNVAAGLLEIFQIQPDFAEDGNVAIAKAEKNTYDLILMDYLMPNMNGMDATKQIREKGVTIPILAVSAILMDETKQQFQEAGMNDLLEKPIQLDALESKLIQWLAKDKIQLEITEKKSTDEDVKSEKEIVIEGLITENGIRNCGNKTRFLKALEDYANVVDYKSSLIENLLKDGDIQTLTIEVHALKSASRTIGALELAEKFAELEQFGHDGIQEELVKKVPSVVELYRKLKKEIEPVISKQIDKMEVSTEQKVCTLQELQDAVDQFDLDGADLAMRKLEQYQFSDIEQKDIDMLKVYVSDVAMEEILSLTQNLISHMTT